MNDRYLNMAEDLVNLPLDKGLSSIKEYVDKYGFGHDNPLMPQGFFHMRDINKGSFVWTEQERRDAEEIAEQQKENSAFDFNKLRRIGLELADTNPDLVVQPKLEVYVAEHPQIAEQVWNNFKKMADRAKRFFYRCRENKRRPDEELDKIVTNIQMSNPEMFRISTASRPPTLSFNRPLFGYKTLEDEIEVKIYLEPLFDGSDLDRWINSRNCELCGKFFFYKNGKAKYCSEKCRFQAHMRRKNMEK